MVFQLLFFLNGDNVLYSFITELTLKDVVNYMELYRLKDRASMIKEVSWDDQDWLD